MMRGRYLVTAGLLFALGYACTAAAALEVNLEVANDQAVARKPAMVTSGIPFAKGALKDVAKLSVSVGGKAIPAQFMKTVAWDDGSVRWALMDTQLMVPASGSAKPVVSGSAKNPLPATRVKADDGAKGMVISTGPLVLVLSKKKPGLIESLKVDGRELLTAAGKGLVIIKANGGEAVAAAPSEIKIERAGPLRVVVCMKGKFPGIHNGLIGYTARISAYAGQKFIKVHLWLENHGADGQGKVKPEWFAFGGMAVDLGLGLGKELTATSEGVEGKGKFKILQVCKKGAKGKRGTAYYTNKGLEYTIHSGDRELKKGGRTDGVLQVKGDVGALTVAIRHFWQNYEKGLELDGSSLRLWLWPKGSEWPRPTKSKTSYRLTRLKNVCKPKMIMLPGSVHKGHEFILDFSGRAAAETSAELSRPVFARATAAYYAGTKALPNMFAPTGIKTGKKFCDFKLRACARMGSSAVDPGNKYSVFKAREEYQTFALGYHGDQSYWYGWMDFGDLSVPGVGQTSLSGDWPLLILSEYLRNGNPNALELATQMARHRIDIDQYWSDRDPPNVNSVQSGSVWPTFHARGRKGGPNAGGTFIAGPALWYMLTGEPKARDACVRSAKGLVVAWEAFSKSTAYGGGTKVNMRANASTISAFCAAYDLTADKKWLDEAMKLFNTNVTTKWKKSGPHLHSPGKGQIVGQGYKREDAAYCAAIGPLCNLHRLTGNKKVFELLEAGCKKPMASDSYYDAPMFAAGLYAYVGGALKNEAYLKKAAKDFMLGFPESKNPPVFMPGNKTWAGRAASLMKAGALVQYGFWLKDEK
jgi:exo-rhamnogalacturonan lyase-like protein